MRSPVVNFCAIAAIVAGLLAFSAPAQALRLSPFSVELAPSGAGATRLFELENDESQPVAVQISMVRREMDVAGRETLTDAESEFIVFPPQIILLPQDQRGVRVQWLGDPAPKAELAYRIVVEQLPIVNAPPDELRGPKITVLFRFEGTLYITPRGARSDLIVERTEARQKNGAPPELAVSLWNRGNAHAIVSGVALDIASEASGKVVRLGEERLERMAGENVLAGQRRMFLLPWPDDLPRGPARASLVVSPPR